MIIGYPPEPQGRFQIKCAYAGCSGPKAMSVRASVGGQTRDMHFAAATFPEFEAGPHTSSRGADLPVETVLRVKWKRLTFYGRDPDIGPIEINIRNKPSLGRVYSISNPSFGRLVARYSPPPERSGTFFPAYNENSLYFQIHVPNLRTIFENSSPVRNFAVIDHIPPTGVEYSLGDQVEFQPIAGGFPAAIAILECRMAMSILKDVHVEVNDFRKTGDTTATLAVAIRNDSNYDRVKVGLVSDSTSNIIATPTPEFIGLDREEGTLEFSLEIAAAAPPGYVTISLVLISPLESRGANRMMIDYDEIKTGMLHDNIPLFTENGFQRSFLGDR